MSQEQIELLQKAFPELSESLLEELAQKVQERTYPIGTVLCREGEIEDTFYIICSGRVVVSKVLDGESSRILTYQGPGEFFGELSLIHDAQRAASVVTMQETTVFELSKKDFMSFLESSPTMVVNIMRAVASRLRDTDQKSITELRRKNKELSQAYRALEAETWQRSSFLTAVAHELRTPLATAKGQLNLIEAGDLPEDQMKGVVETVSTNVDAIVRLVNNIMFLQEFELIEPQFHPVAIETIVRQAVDKIQAEAKWPDLLIHTDIATDLPPVMGDSDSLKQAIIALLESAIRLNPDGCEIHVDVKTHNQTLEITVQDSVLDIPQEDIERLFDHTLHKDVSDTYLSRGISLELPIARAVVEQHRGSLHVSSEKSKGSIFTICLPVSGK